ncbi:MAG TPA: ATP-binding protein [Candidatus Methylomirabilis sp.]|nr:ATP-binding protein [Candidatus Methylomirabilis sp.]
MPRRTLRVGSPLVLVALSAVVLQILCLAVLGISSPGPALSQSLQAFMAVLAGVACYQAGARGGEFARLFWRLAASAFFLWSLAQVVSTFVLFSAPGPHRSGAANIILYFFSFTPLFAALFLSPAISDRARRWEFFLDFMQILFVSATFYLLFLYASWWHLTDQEWVSRRALTVNVRNLLLSAGFVVRVLCSRSTRERELFARVGGPIVLYSIGFWIGKHGIALWSVRLGTWFDLGWSVPFLLTLLLAESWQDQPEEVQPRRQMGLVPIALAFLLTLSLALVASGIVIVRGQISPQEVFLVCAAATALVICFFGRLLLTLRHQRRTFELLQASERRYRSLFERHLAGVFTTTPDGRYIDCNEAYAHIFGCASREEMLSRSPVELYSSAAARDEQVAALREAKTFTNMEARRRRKDGTYIWVLHNVTLLHDEKGNEIIEGTVVDITERKRLEEQLRQSQKMEAIGQLAGGVAHDFNNLLTVIQGYTRLILDTSPSQAETRAYAEHIDSSAERAAALTRHLLAFSRKQVLQPKVIDLNTLVTNLDKMLRRVIGEHIDMMTVAEPRLGAVKADPGQVEQVIMNLVVNARDAMSTGGKITVETANVELDENYAREHEGVQPGRYVMLAVSDTGVGMDAQTQARIFEPFFTTKELGHGTGLGLSTVYGIVKQSGGHIWVYSEKGRGTTFKVYFARVDAPAEALPLPATPSTPARGRENILVVEDDDQLRELTRSVLAACGYSVSVAENGHAVAGICARRSEPIQLLLTDVVMPGVSGREVATWVSTRWPGVKVLYMSGYAPNSIVHHGVLDDGVFFLAKPFTPSTLAAKVREVLDYGSPARK